MAEQTNNSRGESCDRWKVVRTTGTNCSAANNSDDGNMDGNDISDRLFQVVINLSAVGNSFRHLFQFIIGDNQGSGLEAGANDYIRKPFAFEELLARIRVLLRSKEGDQHVFSYGDIEMDIEAYRVAKGGNPVELTQKEFALLEYLLRNKGKVCRRTRIIEKVWDINFEHDTSVIDVYINFLRKKLDQPGAPSFIETIRGVGYRVNEEA